MVVPARGRFLPVVRRYPLSDLLALHLSGDRISTPGGRRGGGRRRSLAEPLTGNAQTGPHRAAAADQGARIPHRNVAPAHWLSRAADLLGLLLTLVLLGRSPNTFLKVFYWLISTSFL